MDTKPASDSAERFRGSFDQIKQADGVLVVPTAQCLTLKLPDITHSRRELAAQIAQRVPLRPAELAWTEPVTDDAGNAQIIMARRSWLDQFVNDAERSGPLVQSVRAEQNGAPFGYHTPAQRRRAAITWSCCAVAICAVLVAGLRSFTADDQTNRANPTVRTISARPVFEGQSLAADLSSMPRLDGANIALSRVERLRDGSLIVEIASAEPDRTRANVASYNLLPGFAEADQLRATDGRYAVRYRREPAGAGLQGSDAQILLARDRNSAESRVRALLTEYAEKRVLQINLAAPQQVRDGMLAFPLELAGPQSDVLNVAAWTESAPPPMRFAEWSLVPAEEGVRLSGLLYVPWAEAPQ